MENFIEQLKKALEDYLGPRLIEEVYIDKERLKIGYHYNEELASAICQSIGMIVVYSPIYERNSYCMREYAAMENIEKKRRQILGKKPDLIHGMIYPILFRGKKEDIPNRIKNKHFFCDFSTFTLASTEICRNEEFIKIIEEIAEDIYNHYKIVDKMGVDICCGCDSFRLPSEEEIHSIRENPLEPIGFPG